VSPCSLCSHTGAQKDPNTLVPRTYRESSKPEPSSRPGLTPTNPKDQAHMPCTWPETQTHSRSCAPSCLNYSRIQPISRPPISLLPNAAGRRCMKHLFCRTQGRWGASNPEKAKCNDAKRDQDTRIFIFLSLMIETRFVRVH